MDKSGFVRKTRTTFEPPWRIRSFDFTGQKQSSILQKDARPDLRRGAENSPVQGLEF